MAKKICIKDLRHRIVIQDVEQLSDGHGGYNETWVTFATVWAKVVPVSAQEKWRAENLDHEVTHRITIRYLANITSSMRISFDGRIFHVKGFRNLEERDRYIEIVAKEGVVT